MPPWRIVYYYFMRWREDGLWIELHDALRDALRMKSGKKKPLGLRYSTRRVLEFLTTGEAVDLMQERRCWAANDMLWKDTPGMIPGVLVTPANVSDPAGAAQLLPEVLTRFGRVRHLWADTAYVGLSVMSQLREMLPWRGLRLEIVRRSAGGKRLSGAAQALAH